MIKSAILLKRFLKRPCQVTSVIRSSKALIKQVADRMDFSVPRVIAELWPGEGCHTREIVRWMAPGSCFVLFELDPQLAGHLREQFCGRLEIVLLNEDAVGLRKQLEQLGHEPSTYCLALGGLGLVGGLIRRRRSK